MMTAFVLFVSILSSPTSMELKRAKNDDKVDRADRERWSRLGFGGVIV